MRHGIFRLSSNCCGLPFERFPESPLIQNPGSKLGYYVLHRLQSRIDEVYGRTLATDVSRHVDRRVTISDELELERG